MVKFNRAFIEGLKRNEVFVEWMKQAEDLNTKKLSESRNQTMNGNIAGANYMLGFSDGIIRTFELLDSLSDDAQNNRTTPGVAPVKDSA